MITNTQQKQDFIINFIRENPGKSQRQLCREIGRAESKPDNLRFKRNFTALLSQGLVFKITVLGEEKYFALDADDEPSILDADDEDGRPLHISAPFVAAPDFIAKSSDPMEWALKNILQA